jgi:hypothetical protein
MQLQARQFTAPKDIVTFIMHMSMCFVYRHLRGVALRKLHSNERHAHLSPCDRRFSQSVCARKTRVQLEPDTIIAVERVGFLSYIDVIGKPWTICKPAAVFYVSTLSRTGMKFYCKMNVCLAPRAFDLELATFLNTVELRERFVSLRLKHASI